MNMYEIISKKKRGESLTHEEIDFFVRGYTRGEIPDYQASALLMAICLLGMNEAETLSLTSAIAESGDSVDLSPFGTLSVDKHSTGGVGDKTTLIVAPLVAALGCKVAKMSGRGLGHTGGTVDKLESFPGYKTALTPNEFFSQVEKIGIAVTGQSGNLAPADKKIYALRDVTATVDSIPLITSSIMGKKLPSGAHNIVLDVKFGSGAFMKELCDACALADSMVKVGNLAKRRVRAVISNMNVPLGRAVGNSLEVSEAIAVLKGAGPSDLRTLSLTLSAEIVSLAFEISREEAMARVTEALDGGIAYKKFVEWISRQGGDPAYAENPELFPKAKYSRDIISDCDGYVFFMDTEKIGATATALGAGRRKKDDVIDLSAGITVRKKTGERVEYGEVIATLYSNKSSAFKEAESLYRSAVEISKEKPKEEKLIYKII